uniref:SusC/RagA family TonB-linked outer membrane protein n=1 Tax=Pedobacter schmidteae TaxID=2201271 RepID=UPI001D018478|nr:TonB-dependent receptor [Pedobacter schmidteae]
MRKIYLFVMCMICTFTVFAQQTRRVEGKVTDQGDGTPLAGVSVQVKGSKVGATTDKDGRYTIKVPSQEKSTLVFSYIGYLAREMSVGNKGVINLTLAEDSKMLSDVVVIGYGTVAKKDLTGAVGSVNMKDMQKAPVKSFDEALAGRVAGVQVASNDGQPGNSFNIVVRGQNSITQDNSPLYVVDGFPLENSNNNAINPADIESIEVLKDASATAIYGARGANGVILITTKGGKVGAPVISYTGTIGFQQNTKRMDLMSPYEFVRLQEEIDPINTPLLYYKDGKTLDSYKDVKGINWQDQVYRTAPSTEHNLSLTGGTDKTQYVVSGSINSQDGVIINSGFKRYQGRMSLTQRVTDKLKVFASIDYSNIKASGTIPTSGTNSATNNLLYSVWGYRPVTGSEGNLLDQLFDPDIDGLNDYRINPVLSSNNELRNATTNNLRVNSYVQYSFNKNLTLKVSGGISNNLRRNDVFYNSQTYYGGPSSTNKVNGSIIYTQNTSWLNENILTFAKRFNKVHNLNVVAGITMQEDKYSRYGLAAIQLPNESVGLAGLSQGTPLPVTAESSNSKLLSFLGRVTYDYKSKYLLSASFRADGSSKFMPGQRTSYFPSGSIAWRMSNEEFMKGLTFVSDAKLRGGYGVTGNNRVGDFSYLSVLGFPIGGSYGFNNTVSIGAIPLTYGNPDLRWESTAQANIGYDLSLFKDRIIINADVYRKSTYDLLLNADLPYTTGYESAFKNIGKVRNEGLEFTLNTRNIENKDFKWSSSFNISFNRSKVMALNAGQSFKTTSISWENSYNATPLYIASVGQPIAQFYGYEFDGVYQFSDFNETTPGVYTLKDNVPNNGNARNSIKPGDIKYKDQDGNLIVDSKDRKVIGRGQPIHVGGLTNNFSYKNFDLSVFLQWSYGNDIYNANRMLFEGNMLDKKNLNQFAGYADRWTPENPSNTLYRVKGQGPAVYSSRVIEDGSFLRIKTVSLGYNFGADFLKKVKLKSLRISASGQNLYTFTNYTGMDPEVSVRNSALTPGFDYSAYPRARTIVFGLNTSF